MTQVTATINEVGGISAPRTPITSSLVFKEGEFFDVGVLVKDTLVESQLNILARHDDGSIRHCLVTFKMVIAANSENVVVFDSDQSKSAQKFPIPGIDPLTMATKITLIDDNDQVWIRKIPASWGWSIIKAAVLPGWEKFATNLHGPLGEEVELTTSLEGLSGKHSNLTAIFRWRLYHNAKAVRTEVVLENSSYPQMDDVSFKTLSISMGGKEVVLLKNRVMYAGTRMRHVEWVGEDQPELIVRQDPTYLRDMGVWPLYDTGNPLTDEEVGKEVKNDFDKGKIDPTKYPDGLPLTYGPIANYMPGTGSRRDIGPLPEWAVLAINSKNRKAAQLLRAADGNASGSFSVHLRDISGYMGLTFDHGVKRGKGKGRNPSVDDRAHQPCLGYVSYVLTGEKYYEEEMMAWASYCTREWPWKKDLKYPGSRDSAWSLRAVVHAAYMLPDNNPLKTYFLDIMNHNLDAWKVRFMDNVVHPLHLWDTGTWKSSGRSRWPCSSYGSMWQFAWHVWSLYNCWKLFGDKRAWDLFEFSCFYFQECYSRQIGATFSSPDGQVITWDPKYADQYSFAVTKHTPYIKPDGQLDVVAESEVLLENLAECLWYIHVNETNRFTSTLPKLPEDGLEPENWRPQPTPQTRVNASTFEEYAMADLAPAMVAAGIPEADMVWAFIKPYIDAKSDPKGLKQTP